VLCDFRRWLVDEKIEQRRQLNNILARPRTIDSKTTLWWIEKLLQTPIDDYRKFAVWRILVPYLINIRHVSGDEANDIIQDWLDKCESLRQLDFNPNYMIRYNINTVKRGG
jgi:Primase X